MKKQIFRVLLLILVILTAVMIFSFSEDNGKESADLSGEITDKVLSIVDPQASSAPPEEYAVRRTNLEHYIRKLAHFSEYLLLGFFWALLLGTFSGKHVLKLILTFAFPVLYAVIDEIHQYFVPGRAAAVKDVLIDSMGAFCGIGVAWLALYLASLVSKRTKAS